jgi:hypothetical protein
MLVSPHRRSRLEHFKSGASSVLFEGRELCSAALGHAVAIDRRTRHHRVEDPPRARVQSAANVASREWDRTLPRRGRQDMNEEGHRGRCNRRFGNGQTSDHAPIRLEKRAG